MSHEFFLAKSTFHQVILIFRVPKDPSLDTSCPKMVLDNPAYTIGSFEGFVTVDTDYST